MSKRRRKKRTGIGLIAITVMVLWGIVAFKSQSLDETYAKSSAKILDLEKKIEKANEEAEEIQEMKAYVQTKKYIEEMAREKLGLVYEDEIIFKAED